MACDDKTELLGHINPVRKKLLGSFKYFIFVHQNGLCFRVWSMQSHFLLWKDHYSHRWVCVSRYMWAGELERLGLETAYDFCRNAVIQVLKLFVLESSTWIRLGRVTGISVTHAGSLVPVSQHMGTFHSNWL